MRKLVVMPVILASAVALSACGSKPVKQETPPQEPPKAEAPAPAPAPTPAPVAKPAYDPLQDPNSALAKRSIYFDYDNFVIKEAFNPVIAAHADYLSKNKARKIVVEGNADERGSSEYNLALGQKRAEAVRKALELLGVSGAQVEAVSHGEEKPKVQGASETAWAENRRADIVYK